MKSLLNVIIFATLIVSGTPNLLAQDGDDQYETYGPQPAKEEEVRKWDVANQEKYKNENDVLILPGLVANRKEKRVEVLTESTGVSGQDALEFLIVHTSSSHGYEALLWSYAKPSDIHKALEFIGLEAGGSRNPAELRFWGKGRKVTALLQSDNGGYSIRLEDLIRNRREDDNIPEKGFIFTGSSIVPTPNNSGLRGYAADLYDPHSIISAFNDPSAVLDVGWQMSKREAYSSYAPSTEYRLDAHDLYTLVLEPKNKDGDSGIRNLTLSVQDPATSILKNSDTGKRIVPESTISAALEACRKMIANGLQPYVTLRFSKEMKLGQIQSICRGLRLLDRPGALRIEPPQKGRLYYRSFIPDKSWRDPANRRTQAWEIHLEKKNDKLTGTMVFHEPVWEEGSFEPEFNTHTFPVSNGEDVRKRLDKDAAERQQSDKRELPPVLMVYASANLNYGQLLDFLQPAMKTHNTVHLFLEQEKQ
ncbi:MAG: YdjY domain-containing protein [Lentisphaeria bacterium]